MSKLREAGYRFMVSPDGKDGDWFHPAEIAENAPGWTDCTEMDDAEFNGFMAVLGDQNPPRLA